MSAAFNHIVGAARVVHAPDEFQSRDGSRVVIGKPPRFIVEDVAAEAERQGGQGRRTVAPLQAQARFIAHPTAEGFVNGTAGHFQELFRSRRGTAVAQFRQPVDVVVHHLDRAVGREAEPGTVKVREDIRCIEPGKKVGLLLFAQAPHRIVDQAVEVHQPVGQLVAGGLILVRDDQAGHIGRPQQRQHLAEDLAVVALVRRLHRNAVLVGGVELRNQRIKGLCAIAAVLVPEREGLTRRVYPGPSGLRLLIS